MSLELLFDGFEEKRSVALEISLLDQMACVRQRRGRAGFESEFRRPHQCVIVWGGSAEAEYIPAMRCVIESLSVKYTMFDPEGRPVRAVANLKLREAVVKKAFAEGVHEADDEHRDRLAAQRVWESSRTEKKERR